MLQPDDAFETLGFALVGAVIVAAFIGAALLAFYVIHLAL